MALLRLIFLLSAFAAQARAETLDFTRDIQPLLTARCTTCHGALKQKGKLRLDAGALVLKGGRDGSAVAPGNPAHSVQIERITATDDSERMPPEGKPMPAAEVELLKRWITAGAIIPEHEEIPAAPEQHWFFQKPIKVALPEHGTLTNPIDRFLAEKWTQHGLTPQAPADRAALLRRVRCHRHWRKSQATRVTRKRSSGC